MYPGAGCVRICTTASFQSQHSSKRITILNTHLDHLTDEPRKYGASLLLIRGKYEAATSKGPVVLTGDFNSAPTGHDSGAYEIVTGKTPPMEVNKKFREKYDPGPLNQLPDFKFLDIRTETPKFGVSGNFSTFTGWSPTVTDEWTRIDFIFGGNNREWCVCNFPESARERSGASVYSWLTMTRFRRVDRSGNPLRARSVRG